MVPLGRRASEHTQAQGRTTVAGVRITEKIVQIFKIPSIGKRAYRKDLDKGMMKLNSSLLGKPYIHNKALQPSGSLAEIAL